MIKPVPKIQKPKKRVLLVSDYAGLHSGYANVSRAILEGLHRDGRFEVANYGWFHRLVNDYQFPWPVITPLKSHANCCRRGQQVMEIYQQQNVTYYKAEQGRVAPMPVDQFCGAGQIITPDKFGGMSLGVAISMFKPHFVLAIGDQWMMVPAVQSPQRESYKLVTYTAVDGTPLPQRTRHPQSQERIDWQKLYQQMDVPVAFCDWAKDTINEMVETPVVEQTIPHFVKRDVFHPLPGEMRQELRRENPWGFMRYDQMGPADDLREKRIALYVGRNIRRKEIPYLFRTVQAARARSDEDLVLLLHTPWEDNGWNMDEMVRQYDAAQWVYYRPDTQVSQGFSEPELNQLYNIADVHLHTSNGEGWDLPALESSAAGVPTIQTDYSAPGDWGQGILYLVQSLAVRQEEITGIGRAVPDYRAAADLLLQILSTYDITQVETSQRLYEATAAFGIETVQQQWIDLLAALNTKDIQPTSQAPPPAQLPQSPAAPAEMIEL